MLRRLNDRSSGIKRAFVSFHNILLLWIIFAFSFRFDDELEFIERLSLLHICVHIITSHKTLWTIDDNGVRSIARRNPLGINLLHEAKKKTELYSDNYDAFPFRKRINQIKTLLLILYAGYFVIQNQCLNS